MEKMQKSMTICSKFGRLNQQQPCYGLKMVIHVGFCKFGTLRMIDYVVVFKGLFVKLQAIQISIKYIKQYK